MKRAGIFFLLAAALAAMGRMAPPLARFLAVTREGNPAVGMEFAAEALPLAGTALVLKNVTEAGGETEDVAALAPDEQLAARTEKILRLMYEVDGREPEQARMLESISRYVTKPYFDCFIQVYSEKLAGSRRSFLEFELDEIRDETVRDAWGEYRTTRNVYAKIHIGHDDRFFWITVKCVFEETGDAYPLDRIMDQIFYVAG
jgi:hypothetical protein